jgi:hypothetical protein
MSAVTIRLLSGKPEAIGPWISRNFIDIASLSLGYKVESRLESQIYSRQLNNPEFLSQSGRTHGVITEQQETVVNYKRISISWRNGRFLGRLISDRLYNQKMIPREAIEQHL